MKTKPSTRGRGTPVEPHLRETILRLIEERMGSDPTGRWNAEIAKAAGVHKDTVRKMRLHFCDTTIAARARLRATAEESVDRWIEAEKVAAGEGRHQPMRDHLVAAGVIQTEGHGQDGGGVKIFIGVGTSRIGPDVAVMPLKREKDWNGADHMQAARALAAQTDDE